jgi:endoglucanase
MTNTKRNPIHFLLAVILLGAVLSAIPMSLGIPGSKDIVAFARTRSSVTEPAGNLTASLPLSGTAGNTASLSVSGKLHVNGSKLCDSKGQPVQLRGISTHGIGWFPEYINEECFAQLRTQWNVNVMRLAMYTAEYNGYLNGGDQNQLKALIRNGVQYAADHDMYVIIDWHILSDSNPNQHIEEACAFFDEMSKEFAGRSNVLYEICNEPNGGTTWNDIKTYASSVIGIIRKNDKDAVIIVGTPNWSQYVDEAAKDPITGYDNIMYALHFYAATHKDDLRNRMVSAVEAGLPIFVTEYGICDASGNGTIDRAEAEQWVHLMDLHDVSYVAWNLSNKSETSAILKSSCTKTRDFTEDDLSESGKWLYDMLTGKDLSPTH